MLFVVSCATAHAKGSFSYCFAFHGGGGAGDPVIYTTPVFGYTDEYWEDIERGAYTILLHELDRAFSVQTGHGHSECDNRKFLETLQEAKAGLEAELKSLAEMGWKEVRYINPPCEHRYIYCPNEHEV